VAKEKENQDVADNQPSERRPTISSLDDPTIRDRDRGAEIDRRRERAHMLRLKNRAKRMRKGA
jgi:hypothetical protein